ncbi:MAG: DUF503 domain-containing protein [Anaerolineales bacterium]|nr:DUF503 domain-containing protein [Anaerolineales bacterium]
MEKSIYRRLNQQERYMSIGLLTLNLLLPGCTSLKEKRRRLKPLLHRMHREFNISVAEIDYQDRWQEALIACTLISNDNGHTQRSLRKVIRWIEKSWPDVTLMDDQLEII